MLISYLKETIEKNFGKSKYKERIRALAYVADMSKKFSSFDMILPPDTHAWLKRTLKGICYVSDDISITGNGNVDFVVARDRESSLKHEERR